MKGAGSSALPEGSTQFELNIHSTLFAADTLQHLAQALAGAVADPAPDFLVMIKMEAAGARSQPELAQGLLATEDQLAAILEAHAQHAATVLQIDILSTLVETVFDRLLYVIYQVMETGTTQCHGRNLGNLGHGLPIAAMAMRIGCRTSRPLSCRKSAPHADMAACSSACRHAGAHRQAAGWPVYSSQ